MPGGWADHHRDDGRPRTLAPGQAPRGVFLTEMPAPRPRTGPPRIKGLPGPSGETDEDHQPGGGEWTSDLGNRYSPDFDLGGLVRERHE